MYSRSYYQDEQAPTPPQNYDGTAFSATEEFEGEEQSVSAGVNFAPKAHSSQESLFGLGGLFDIFGKDKLSLSKIGTEELLILAAAAFLLFSKGGDKECAIILLILLFIN